MSVKLLLTWLLLASGIVSAGAASSAPSKVYRCFAKAAVHLQDNGTLATDGVAEHKRKTFNGIIIDTLTGALTYPDGERHVWEVVQKGSGINDHVLAPRFRRPGPNLQEHVNEAAASGATFFIRVRAWDSEPQATFMAFELSTLVTGTCEIVR